MGFMSVHNDAGRKHRNFREHFNGRFISMEKSNFKIYGYRWVLLLAFMLIILVNQLLWITFASITGDAAAFYKVSDLSIGILSLTFMLVYIIVSIPASWMIDTYGIRIAVGIGAALTGIFGMLRGVFASDYQLVLYSQIGIAIGQPFILNAMTTVAARWFPIHERATASGLASLSVYTGLIIGLALTPYLSNLVGINHMLVDYGIFALVAAIVFIVFAREHPPTPPCRPDQVERSLVFDGLKHILRQRNFIYLLFIFFVGLGVFNAVTTWIDDILRTRHFTETQVGIVGGALILGGVIGAIVMPPLSDRYKKRVPFFIAALAGSIPGLIGLTFAITYSAILLSAFSLGFFLLSAGPIGFQYGAEIAYPAPEGTSNGLLLMIGQIAGIAFIFGMDKFKSTDTGSMRPGLIVLIWLIAFSLLICTRFKESKLLTNNSNH
jgi:MFS family permease